MTERKPHPHAEIIMEFARRAQEGTQFDGLQFRILGDYLEGVRWRDAGNYTADWMDWNSLSSPVWHLDIEYRYKPQTININGHEVPEPLSAVPEIGTFYHVVDLVEGSVQLVRESQGLYRDSIAVSRGIAHATRNAAEKHAEALLSFTMVESGKDVRNYD